MKVHKATVVVVVSDAQLHDRNRTKRTMAWSHWRSIENAEVMGE